MNDIRDISLAPSGELKIAWVRRNMAVLRGIEADFAAEKPFAGMKIALSVLSLIHIWSKFCAFVVLLHKKESLTVALIYHKTEQESRCAQFFRQSVNIELKVMLF